MHANDSHLSDLQELKDTLKHLSNSGIAGSRGMGSDDIATRANVAAALAASGISPGLTLDSEAGHLGMSGMAAPFGDLTQPLASTDLDLSLTYDKAVDANANSAHSSKAVLAALRALQGKIRRLENERDNLTSNCISLKEKIKLVRLVTCIAHLTQHKFIFSG